MTYPVEREMSVFPAIRAAKLPVAGGWCAEAREDPITGLVAYPDFDRLVPEHLVRTLRLGGTIGLAIGDVDNLKEYVETSNSLDPSSFGHLAGNALMARLGRLAVEWFGQQPFEKGCVSTFGGDEIIIAASAGCGDTFHCAIQELRDLFAARLPRSVSFAVTVLEAERVPAVMTGWISPRRLYTHLAGSTDRCLFARKGERPRTRISGFVASVDIPSLPVDQP
jgi:GGDEF domain-containing protein